MRQAAAAILFAALPALAAHGAPVAFVADLRGNATIEGEGRKLVFLAELAPGTRLLLGSHASAAITYAATGAEFTLAGPGQYLVGPEEVIAERGSKPRRRGVAVLLGTSVVGQASQSATASLRMRGLVPVATPAILEFPVSTRVATLRPSMRWRSSPGEEYTLALQDAAGSEIWKGRGKAEGTLPGPALDAATRYSWTVASSRGVLAEGHFETLPSEAIGRVEKSRASARTFSDRVVHALLLQELGAEQEARDAWAALARERPDLRELNALAR